MCRLIVQVRLFPCKINQDSAAEASSLRPSICLQAPGTQHFRNHPGVHPGLSTAGPAIAGNGMKLLYRTGETTQWSGLRWHHRRGVGRL